jgi:hypothetical protein
LTNTEAVFIDHFIDLNANGVVDANDLLVGHFLLSDGQRSTIGGITNLNVPGDLTAVDGAITSHLNYFGPTPQWPIGSHLLRLSSPSGRFPGVTNRLTITNWPFAQMISGTVQSGSTNVPYAELVFDYGFNGGIAGATVADCSGNFSFRAPADNYAIIGVRPGYVLHGKVPVSLGTNATVTTNVTLSGTSRTLAGRVANAAQTSEGLGAVLVFISGSGGNLTGTFTDTNGNFSLPVTPEIWTVSAQENSGLASLGYVHRTGNVSYQADTSTGSVANAFLSVPKGTAMFYGQIKNQNAPVPGVKFFSGDQQTNLYASTGWSDANGNYAAVTTAENWNISVSADDPIFREYVVSIGVNANLRSNSRCWWSSSSSRPRGSSPATSAASQVCRWRVS